jgi:uncharacterized protein YneF (UPF0154 family)
MIIIKFLIGSFCGTVKISYKELRINTTQTFIAIRMMMLMVRKQLSRMNVNLMMPPMAMPDYGH